MSNPVRVASPFARDIDAYINAGYQSLVVDTSEIRRVEEEIYTLLQMGFEAILTWDVAVGLVVQKVADNAPAALKRMAGKVIEGVVPAGSPSGAPKPKLSDPAAALRRILDTETFEFSNCVIIMRNLHVALNRDVVVAQIWQTAVNDRKFNTVVERVAPNSRAGTAPTPQTLCRLPIIIGTGVEIGRALLPTVTHLEFRLPDLQHMRELVTTLNRSTVAQQRASSRPVSEPTEEFAETLARALLGFTSVQASDALALCAVEHATLATPDVLNVIETQKADVLRSNTSLTYVPRRNLLDRTAAGGFDKYMTWLDRRKVCYTRRAEELNLDPPKGVVLIGVPGSGKSLMAKISANILGLPLLVLDVGSIFGSLVGESERRMNDALKTIEAIQGCVVLIDEADKLWNGASQATGDSGVTQRVFGRFLSWLADKKDGSFIIMTMNRVAGLPPEFLRKGRFDEIFYTDIPTEQQRLDILKIHLRRRNLNVEAAVPDQAAWDRIAAVTKDFVGAEVETVVSEAWLAALADRGESAPTIDDLCTAAEVVIPLHKLDSENIDEIRNFCKTRARPVCTPEALPEVQADAPRRVTGLRGRTAKPTESSGNDPA